VRPGRFAVFALTGTFVRGLPAAFDAALRAPAFVAPTALRGAGRPPVFFAAFFRVFLSAPARFATVAPTRRTRVATAPARFLATVPAFAAVDPARVAAAVAAPAVAPTTLVARPSAVPTVSAPRSSNDTAGASFFFAIRKPSRWSAFKRRAVHHKEIDLRFTIHR